MKEKIKDIAKSTLRRSYSEHLRLINELHNNSKQIELSKENLDEFTLFLDDYDPKHHSVFRAGGHFLHNSDLIKELNDLIREKSEFIDELIDDLWAIKKMSVIQFVRWKGKKGTDIPQYLKND